MYKLIITITVGLITASVVGYLFFNNLDTSIQGQEESMQAEEKAVLSPLSSESIKGKNSIRSLFELRKNMECTFSFSSDGVRGEGTGFFADGNARVDSLYLGTSSNLTASYMISDKQNKVMYSWTLDDGVAQGVKMAIPDDVPENTTDAPDTSTMAPSADAGVTPETDVEYDCKPWSVDNSVFVPPADVEFMDVTSM